jgi:hypothetical protein
MTPHWDFAQKTNTIIFAKSIIVAAIQFSMQMTELLI